MPQNYREQHFEDHIEQHLLQSGYRKGLAAEYDKDLCLMPEEVIRFLQSTQPNEYAKLEQQYGANTPQKLCARIAHEISQKGTLDVLRKGVKDRGVKFRLAYYQPQSGLNPEHERLYRLNRFTVVRQLRYSRKNENSLDLVLFLNGLPIITAELKNSLTGQFVEDAIKQYQSDRDPAEALLKFKRCLVHFAVGSEKVSMTTRAQKAHTHFLPFNKDTENPVNPHGHQTAYLWEDLWQPPVLLTLLDRYLCFETREETLQRTSETGDDRIRRTPAVSAFSSIRRGAQHSGSRTRRRRGTAVFGAALRRIRQIRFDCLAGAPIGRTLPARRRRGTPVRLSHRGDRPARVRPTTAKNYQSI